MKPYYQDDYVTLYHADCLEHPELWTGVDVMVSDPPYGIRFEKMGSKNAACPSGHVGQTDWIAGDKDTAARDEALRLFGDKPAILFGSWKAERPDRTRSRIVWFKAGGGLALARCTVMTQDEEIYFLGSGFVQSAPGLPSVIATSEHRSSYSQAQGHSHAKPLELMELLLERCQPEWVVADPFAGSGSTLVAAKRLGRKAIGVELEEKYCEIAARRLSQGVLELWEVGA